MITIIDYGLGNVRAFLNLFSRLNIKAEAARTPEELRAASKVVLPGVGAFDHAMERLEDSGMRSVLEDRVLNARVPLLGVCVGMQMLARSSEEGVRPGLGWIDATVKRLAAGKRTERPLPHMGWNDVTPLSNHGLFAGLETAARFYFLHSYFIECGASNALAVTEYGTNFCCAVASGNVMGVQFHPEKSHGYGAQLLRNFASL